jgi:hypothetical protein
MRLWLTTDGVDAPARTRLLEVLQVTLVPICLFTELLTGSRAHFHIFTTTTYAAEIVPTVTNEGDSCVPRLLAHSVLTAGQWAHWHK